MHKYFFFMVLFFMMHPFSGFSQQEKMSDTEKNLLRKKIIEKSRSINTIVSDFEQTKHLDFLSNDIKSSGSLVFKSPDLIKWEYETPFRYSVIFKNEKLYINDDGDKSKIDLGSNKTFKSLNGLIIKSVKGDMFDDDKFQMEYAKSKSDYIIKFTPKDASLKALIHDFILSFDRVSLEVVEIKMMENTEDYTLIKFIGQKINSKVNEEVFNN